VVTTPVFNDADECSETLNLRDLRHPSPQSASKLTLSRCSHHPYCSQSEKAVEVWLSITKSPGRATSRAFVLYRRLLTDLSHADLDNKFAAPIALISSAIPPRND
jgi:hypothetical protein